MDIFPNGTYGEIKHKRGHSQICRKDPKIEAKAAFLFDLKDNLARQFWNLKDVYETIASLLVFLI